MTPTLKNPILPSGAMKFCGWPQMLGAANFGARLNAMMPLPVSSV